MRVEIHCLVQDGGEVSPIDNPHVERHPENRLAFILAFIRDAQGKLLLSAEKIFFAAVTILVGLLGADFRTNREGYPVPTSLFHLSNAYFRSLVTMTMMTIYVTAIGVVVRPAKPEFSQDLITFAFALLFATITMLVAAFIPLWLFFTAVAIVAIMVGMWWVVQEHFHIITNAVAWIQRNANKAWDDLTGIVYSFLGCFEGSVEVPSITPVSP